MKYPQCPDCKEIIPVSFLKHHIRLCKSYQSHLYQKTIKIADSMHPEDLQFLVAEMELAKEMLAQRIQSNKEKQSEQVEEVQFHPPHQMKEEPALAVDDRKINVSQESEEPNDLEELFSSKRKNNADKWKKGNKMDDYLEKKRISTQNEKKRIELDPKIPHIEQIQLIENQSGSKRQETMLCTNCERSIQQRQFSEIVFVDVCGHLFCNACMVSYITDQYVTENGNIQCLSKNCKAILAVSQIREIIGVERFEKLENLLLRNLMNLVVCCKCKQEFQFNEGNAKDAPKKDQEGNPVTIKSAEHFAANRFNCPNPACRAEQCKSCHASPYHLGKTCDEQRRFQSAKKCRYCNSALAIGYTSSIGIKAFDDVCEEKECKKITKNACSKVHKCGHPCMGYIRERECLPCLKEECSRGKVPHAQDENQFCSICYIEDLKASPCVMSKCGHIFHYKCLEKRLQIRWLTPRILFNFCQCPLCKEQIEVKEDCPLNRILKQNEGLSKSIKEKALLRLKNENLDKDKRITDRNSEYYNKETEYALAIYAYFECYKCKKPYFGGRKSCAEVMDIDGSREGSEFDASKLICAECCPIPTKDCPKHGKQFMTFKCKFCCNISQWFCWGNTHFCDPCHKRQVSGEYISKIPKDKLPKCQGGPRCPSGGEHPENGEEFNLGCLLCRNYKEHHRQI